MRKLTIITACILTYAASAFAAKLPSASYSYNYSYGYSGPYQVPEYKYDDLADFFDNSRSYSEFQGSFGPDDITTSAGGTTDCLATGYINSDYNQIICNACVEDYLWMITSGDYCLAAAIAMSIDGTGCTYAVCASKTCGWPLEVINPELGAGECKAPIGAETPLIFFALSCLALRFWRKKENA